MKQLKLFLLLLLLLAVSACSNSKNSASSNTSFGLEKSLSYCSPFHYGDNLGFNAKVQTVGVSTDPNFFKYVQIKLTSMPQSFLQGTTELRFYRYWFNPGNPTAQTDDARLKLEIVNAKNPTYPVLSNITKFSLADLQSYGNLNDLVIVVDVGGENSKGIEMVLVNSSNGSELGSTYTLLPPFVASPSTYKQQKQSSYGSAVDTMMLLHPYNNRGNLGNDEQYAQQANSEFCFNGLINTHP